MAVHRSTAPTAASHAFPSHGAAVTTALFLFLFLWFWGSGMPPKYGAAAEKSDDRTTFVGAPIPATIKGLSKLLSKVEKTTFEAVVAC